MKTLKAHFGSFKFPLDRGFKSVFYTLIFPMIWHAGKIWCKCCSSVLTILKIYNHSSDTLTLHDGISEASPLLAKHCGGSIPPTYYSETNVAFIHFQTGGSVTETGFELEYTPSSKLSSTKISIIFLFLNLNWKHSSFKYLQYQNQIHHSINFKTVLDLYFRLYC